MRWRRGPANLPACWRRLASGAAGTVPSLGHPLKVWLPRAMREDGADYERSTMSRVIISRREKKLFVLIRFIFDGGELLAQQGRVSTPLVF